MNVKLRAQTKNKPITVKIVIILPLWDDHKSYKDMLKIVNRFKTILILFWLVSCNFSES